MQITPEVVTFIGVLAGILATLALILYVLERRQHRADELAEFRRTIEAMRRLEQQEDHR